MMVKRMKAVIFVIPASISIVGLLFDFVNTVKKYREQDGVKYVIAILEKNKKEKETIEFIRGVDNVFFIENGKEKEAIMKAKKYLYERFDFDVEVVKLKK